MTPNVILPEVVTVPDNDKPDTVPVPDTLVTVPVLLVLLLNVFQSVLDKYPFVVLLACEILIAGVLPPDDEIGAVPVTEVTVPFVGVVQDNEPAVAPAVKTLPLFVVPVAGTCRNPSAVLCVIAGVVPPDDASAPLAVTEVTGAVPLDAAVILPFASTVKAVLV